MKFMRLSGEISEFMTGLSTLKTDKKSSSFFSSDMSSRSSQRYVLSGSDPSSFLSEVRKGLESQAFNYFLNDMADARLYFKKELHEPGMRNID